MIVINTVDSIKFTFNGIIYFKNFTPVVRGDKVEVVNTYDRKISLTDFPTDFSEFTVNGVTYASVILLQQALLPVLFTRASLGGGVGGAFIPLAGTEAGSPVTGSIEINEEVNIFFQNANYQKYINFGFEDEGISLLTFDNILEHESSIQITPSLISIFTTNPLSKGLTSSFYYGANYDDNTYVQKKYVDDTKNITQGYTVATLPASPVAGQRAHVTDLFFSPISNFYSTVTGGGSNFSPVFFDGTNWRVG